MVYVGRLCSFPPPRCSTLTVVSERYSFSFTISGQDFCILLIFTLGQTAAKLSLLGICVTANLVPFSTVQNDDLSSRYDWRNFPPLTLPLTTPLFMVPYVMLTRLGERRPKRCPSRLAVSALPGNSLTCIRCSVTAVFAPVCVAYFRHPVFRRDPPI